MLNLDDSEMVIASGEPDYKLHAKIGVVGTSGGRKWMPRLSTYGAASHH
jgi:hypothetical protein